MSKSKKKYKDGASNKDIIVDETKLGINRCKADDEKCKLLAQLNLELYNLYKNSNLTPANTRKILNKYLKPYINNPLKKITKNDIVIYEDLIKNKSSDVKKIISIIEEFCGQFVIQNFSNIIASSSPIPKLTEKKLNESIKELFPNLEISQRSISLSEDNVPGSKNSSNTVLSEKEKKEHLIRLLKKYAKDNYIDLEDVYKDISKDNIAKISTLYTNCEDEDDCDLANNCLEIKEKTNVKSGTSGSATTSDALKIITKINNKYDACKKILLKKLNKQLENEINNLTDKSIDKVISYFDGYYTDLANTYQDIYNDDTYSIKPDENKDKDFLKLNKDDIINISQEILNKIGTTKDIEIINEINTIIKNNCVDTKSILQTIVEKFNSYITHLISIFNKNLKDNKFIEYCDWLIVKFGEYYDSIKSNIKIILSFLYFSLDVKFDGTNSKENEQITNDDNINKYKESIKTIETKDGFDTIFNDIKKLLEADKLLNMKIHVYLQTLNENVINNDKLDDNDKPNILKTIADYGSKHDPCSPSEIRKKVLTLIAGLCAIVIICAAIIYLAPASLVAGATSAVAGVTGTVGSVSGIIGTLTGLSIIGPYFTWFFWIMNILFIYLPATLTGIYASYITIEYIDPCGEGTKKYLGYVAKGVKIVAKKAVEGVEKLSNITGFTKIYDEYIFNIKNDKDTLIKYIIQKRSSILNENDKVIYDRLLVNIGSFHWFFDYPKLINICNDMYKINEIGNTNLRNIILHILLLTILSMCIIFPQPSFAIIKALIYLLSITMKGGFVFTSFLSKNIGDFYSLCKKNLPKEYSSKLSSFIKEAFGSREKIFNMRLR